MQDHRIAIGLVVGLDYHNPLLEPYQAFLQFKKHPLIAEIISGGKVLQQGAKTLNAGGLYAMPQLAVNGALFVGDSASMLNIQRLKGIHTAMQSGILAAEAIMDAFEASDFSKERLNKYTSLVKSSWVYKELFKARNFSQAMSRRFPLNFVHIGYQHLTAGKGFDDPLSIDADSKTLNPLPNIQVETPMLMKDLDGNLYVDKLTGVYLSGTQHEEDQPCHLLVHDRDLCVTRCYELFRMPCTRFCPASVYEMDEDENGQRQLKLNPANCLHCKTCEIKDPFDNITWTCPEGGGGPRYSIV
jgi:electron-transferring-flavoprotein dehydrogenase